MSWLFGAISGGSGKGATVDGKKRDDTLPPINVLVIDSYNHKGAVNWQAIFATVRVPAPGGARPIKVVQCGWDEFHVMADGPHSKSPCIVSAMLRRSAGPGGQQPKIVTIKPDFVLVRNEVTGNLAHWKNKLFGLMYANVPGLNSLSSVYSFCERAVVQAELNRISRENGDRFRLVPQSYFASAASFFYGNKFPAVVKLGSHHAGFGKMKIMNYKDMEDFKSVLAVTPKYCFAEPFVEGKYDLRIQKIGSHYRAFKRVSISGTWKTNTQSSHAEPVELTPEYKFWADEAAKMFGGLDIVTVDAIHNVKDGKEYIMEVNGTSSGLLPTVSAQDNAHIRDLVVQKLAALVASRAARDKRAAEEKNTPKNAPKNAPKITSKTTPTDQSKAS